MRKLFTYGLLVILLASASGVDTFILVEDFNDAEIENTGKDVTQEVEKDMTVVNHDYQQRSHKRWFHYQSDCQTDDDAFSPAGQRRYLKRKLFILHDTFLI